MNRIFKRHFVCYDENIHDLTLESFAIKSIERKKRVIYIDKKKSTKECLETFGMISKKTFGKTTFVETSSLEEIIDRTIRFELLFVRYYCKDINDGGLLSGLPIFFKNSELDGSVLLLNLSDCSVTKEEFDKIGEFLHRHNSQLGIRTDDISLINKLKHSKNTIFYTSARNVEFL